MKKTKKYLAKAKLSGKSFSNDLSARKNKSTGKLKGETTR